MRRWRRAALAWVVVGSWACAAPSSGPEETLAADEPAAAGTPQPAEGDFVVCKEPRPQACTREMRPVCAHTMNGMLETRPNGCQACTDPNILGHRAGPCG